MFVIHDQCWTAQLLGDVDYLKHIMTVNCHNEFENYIYKTIVNDCDIYSNVLDKWYSAADVGIIPSYSEQCSYSALEMMSHGLKIVSSNAIGLRDIFDEGLNAFIAKIDTNEDKYATNIVNAIENALKCEDDTFMAMRRNMQKMIATDYSAEVMGEKYFKLCNNLACGNCKGISEK